jgi:hypothetical protein
MMFCDCAQDGLMPILLSLAEHDEKNVDFLTENCCSCYFRMTTDTDEKPVATSGAATGFVC